jgi:hypothetical protein
MKTCSRKFLFLLILPTLLLCLAASGVSWLSNQGLPDKSAETGQLGPGEKARLLEAIHLRQAMGSQVWPGFAESDIPLVIYNEEYAFLIGYPAPPAGWKDVPQGRLFGAEWEPVPGDDFFGESYYRQRLPGPDTTPQAFTVRVGERWAASFQTKEWMEITLRNVLQRDLPPFLSSVAPYRIIGPIFIRGSDGYIAALTHESFHAFQGSAAGGRLEEAERTNQKSQDHYPHSEPDFADAWQLELDLLAEALKTSDLGETRQLVMEFLLVRADRRKAFGLASALVRYEQEREWAEGLARYAELSLWQAGSADSYQPVTQVQSIRDFKNYSGFDTRWKQEIDQIRRMAANDGDGRFYYSGMAQAFLLDRLSPGWKINFFNTGSALEDALEDALLQN